MVIRITIEHTILKKPFCIPEAVDLIRFSKIGIKKE